MATKQSDGLSNSTVNSTHNNGGTITARGSTRHQTSFKLQDIVPTESVSSNGSTVVEGVSTGKALDLGVFGYNNPRPVGEKITDTICNIPNTTLKGGASEPNLITSNNKMVIKDGSENFVDGTRTRRIASAIRDNHFNLQTGKFESGYPINAEDIFVADEAAKLSRKNQGSYRFKTASNIDKKNHRDRTG
jgi:hypothetical protein